jgi:demethylmenaquinone methyltransferase/2-methoxy-6-polyprenyl-1,4-benzoquinol methylase
MAHLTGSERAQYVQGMFTRIAPRYDLINRLITFGQDRRWRREAIRQTNLPPTGSLLLDLGAGTGDLGFEALQQNPTTISIEVDFTLEMMRVGQQRTTNPSTHSQSSNHPFTHSPISWAAADALHLPFPDHTFDAVVSGFLLRNVIDLPQLLSEILRVLKPGGRMVALDTTRPKQNLVTPLVRFYMHTVIPLLGWLLANDYDAYTYLPDSSATFLSAEELTAHMAAAGFREILFRRFNLGTIAIHWGIK